MQNAKSPLLAPLGGFLRIAPIVLLSLTGAAVACVDLTGLGEDQCVRLRSYGSFFGRASGAATDSLAGCAYFTVDTANGRFGMVLTNGGPQNTSHMVKLFRSSRPRDVGTIAVGTAPDQIWGIVFLSDRKFTLSTGSVVIQGTTARTIDGTLNLTGIDSVGAAVTIAGTFSGKCTGNDGDPAPDRPNGEKNPYCDLAAATRLP